VSQVGGDDAEPPRHVVNAVPREARSFQGHTAGVVTRTAANAVDFAVTVAVVIGGYSAWSAVSFLVNPTRFTFPAPPFIVLLGCGAVFLFCYFVVSWTTTGRTYGDHLLGLRVVNFRGNHLLWPGAIVRAALCVVFPIGLYWALISPTNRSLQDSLLRTSVLYDWTTKH
jgi:uncharacterized RDD family membrane protein YckC